MRATQHFLNSMGAFPRSAASHRSISVRCRDMAGKAIDAKSTLNVLHANQDFRSRFFHSGTGCLFPDGRMCSIWVKP